MEEIKQFELNLPFFKGPIELLLHLIQKKSLDITEISLSLITKEFLDYVNAYKQIEHIKIAEFLEVASHFIYIKSFILLPFNEEENLDEEENDYRKNLIDRLIEYNKLQKGFLFIKERKNSFFVMRKENPFLKEVKTQYHIEYINSLQLFDKVSRFFRESPTVPLSRGEIRLETLSVEERISWFTRLLNRFIHLSFFKVIKKLSFTDQIVSFLASLELGKQKKVLLTQKEVFGDIDLEKVK